jgi:leucyl aminopeptidase
MNVSFLKEAKHTDVAVVVAVYENKALSDVAKFLDETTQGFITKALKSNRFSGKKGEVLSIIAPNDLNVTRIVLAGFGAKDKLTPKALMDIGAAMAKAVSLTPDIEMVLHLGSESTPDLPADQFAAHLVLGARLKLWRFDKYRTTLTPDKKSALQTISVIADAPEAATKAYQGLNAQYEGVALCRDLATEPGNKLYPTVYADRITQELKPLGIEVEILDVKAMEKLGMGALLGVAMGSCHEPRVVIMHYKGGGSEKPLAFIGKGVTFDSGGISIKPAQGMEDMKYDMCGSAAVVGLMKTLALRKAKVNVVGLVGLVENMPSATAQRPGDIVTSLSGQTIQVENTDAEGRLVLCDVLWYTQDRFKPQFMIDLATLTGAIVISLGDVYAGLFSNNDDLAANLLKSGEASGDMVWRLPLHDSYDKQLDMDCADMNNMGGRKAGSITAAQFLKRFVNNVPWAHLDIAGTAYMDKEYALGPKGATGIGVRLLNQLVADYYEK